jgi:pimeloyl-ACP methyl ester carboxylesterase
MTRETVVYVHGLWLSGRESLFLRRRLAHDYDYDVRTFRYPAVPGSMARIAEQLQELVTELRPHALHFVGHSLGGLVIHRFLERFPQQPPGRVVFLGTPALGCKAAVGVGRLKWASALVGKCVAEELLVEHERRWVSSHALGIIAGTRPMGLGQFFGDLDGPNDGTVAVAETKLPGATDHICLAVSHMGMLLSPRVGRETGEFLRHGRFALAPRQSLFTSERSS